MDENHSKYIKKTVAMVVNVQNLGVRTIVTTSENIMERKSENVM